MTADRPNAPPASSASPRRRDWEERSFPLYGIPSGLDTALLSRWCPARMLPRILWHKLAQRVRGGPHGLVPAAVYNQLVVFDRPEMDGGGLVYAQDFPRLVLELGIGRQARLCEFAAGPGYIGYLLLANGFCEHLTLLDVDRPAIEAAEFTARYNRVQDRVTACVTDGLDQVPASESWGLVVANPPQLPHAGQDERTRIVVDEGWTLHRKFYRSIRKHMQPGGHVIFIENGPAPENSIFREMIEAGGGTLLQTLTRCSVPGAADSYHYVISRW